MPHGSDAMSMLSIGEFMLDLEAGVLFRRGKTVQLRSKAFLLLCHLARNRGRVLSKSDLLDAIWPDVEVTEDSLTQAVRDVRVCLEDEAARFVKTVARRGYMLELCAEAERAKPVSAVPRIAVLPFEDRTDQPNLGPLIAILCDEIVSGLARFKMLAVIGRNSVVLAARLHPDDLTQMAQLLSADYVIMGTAWPGQGGFLLSVTLIETATGAITWSDSFDCAGDRVLRLRDAVPRMIVGHLFSLLEADSSAHAERIPTENLTAFAHFARGTAALKGFRSETDIVAVSHFEKAIQADPWFGLAHAYLALAQVAANGYSFSESAVKVRALVLAQRAVLLSPDDARCQSTLGWLLAMTGQYEAAEQAVRLSMRLNPTDSECISDAALVLAIRGKLDEALELTDRAREINPLPPAWFDTVRYDILHLLGRYREAAESLARIPELNGMRSLRMAAIQLKAGNEAEARRYLDRATLLLPPGNWLAMAKNAWETERPEDLERILQDICDVMALSK